jgi:hypothetical protein
VPAFGKAVDFKEYKGSRYNLCSSCPYPEDIKNFEFGL